MSYKKSKFKEYFSFSKGERNGTIVLTLLIVILLLAPSIFKSFYSSIPSDNSEFYEKTDSFFSSLKLKPDETYKTNSNPIENEEVEVASRVNRYFYFDPNTATINELIQLGFSGKQAGVIERYRSKGGQFHTPLEFSKIYVVDSFTFQKLKPWIRIEPLVSSAKPKTYNDSLLKVEKTPVIVELNMSDTLDLVKIKGIGKVYARRIVAYRNLLGGFYSIQQLYEIYGFKKDLVNAIAPFFTIDSTRIRSINLNIVSFEDLKKHPYLSEYQARAIIFYRSKVGNIKNIDELLVNKVLSIEKYRKVKRYLTTN
jgi:competence protein ComEA